MHRRALFTLFIGLGLFANCHAAEIAGVKFQDDIRLDAADSALRLNGVGLREYLFLDVYAGALYLPKAAHDAAHILASNEACRMSLVMLRRVGAKRFSEGFHEGLRDNNDAADLARFKTQIDELVETMFAVGELKRGDVLNIDYLPASGMHISLNDRPIGKPIAGTDFYRLILRMWLGDDPVDAGLKRGVLGLSNSVQSEIAD